VSFLQTFFKLSSNNVNSFVLVTKILKLKEDQMIGVIAELKIQDGKQDEFEAVFTALAAEVREKEDGNRLYQLTKSRADPTVYKVMELYVDQAALDAHGQTDHFKAAGKKMGGCMGGAPKIEIVDAV